MEEAGRTHLRFALHGVHNAFLAMLVAQQRAQHRRHQDAGEGFPGVGGHLLAAVGAVHLLTRRARAAFRGAHSPARADAARFRCRLVVCRLAFPLYQRLFAGQHPMQHCSCAV